MGAPKLIERGRSADEVLDFILSELAGSPTATVLLGANDNTLTVKPIRLDGQGRVLVSLSSQAFDIVNTALADTVSEIISGGNIFRRVTFYVKNANALLSFRLGDGRVTDEISVVPNLPLTIEGVFAAALGRNEGAGIISTVQAVVNFDLLPGQ